MASDNTRTFEMALRQRQRKLTRPRQAVLDVIAEAGQHLTPAEVYQRAKARYPKLGLTTVYRTLELLTELGRVQRVHAEGGCHSYVAALRTHSHHLLCSSCGRTEEFADCDVQALVDALQDRTGYRISEHILELVGCCPACQAKDGARAAQC